MRLGLTAIDLPTLERHAFIGQGIWIQDGPATRRGIRIDDGSSDCRNVRTPNDRSHRSFAGIRYCYRGRSVDWLSLFATPVNLRTHVFDYFTCVVRSNIFCRFLTPSHPDQSSCAVKRKVDGLTRKVTRTREGSASREGGHGTEASWSTE